MNKLGIDKDMNGWMKYGLPSYKGKKRERRRLRRKKIALKKDPAEHYRNQRQRSGGVLLYWLEVRFRASRENLQALLRLVALGTERFSWLETPS